MANRALAAKAERATKQRRELARIEGSKPFYLAHSNAKDVPWYGGGAYIPKKRFGKGESTTPEGRHASFEEHRGIASVGKTNRTTTPRQRPEIKMLDGWVAQRKRYSGREKLGAAVVWSCDPPRLIKKYN